MQPCERPPHVVIVTSSAPFGSGEAFAIREALALERAGVTISLAPVRPRGEVTHQEGARWKRSAESVVSRPVLSAVWKRFARYPLRTVAIFFRVLRASLGRSDGVPAPALNDKRYHHRVPLKNIIGFIRGCQLAAYCEDADVRHIHAYWASVPATVAFVASELSGIPWSFSAHRWDIYEDNMLGFKARNALFVRTISNRGAEIISGVEPRACVRPIHVGVDVRISPDLKEIALSGSARFVSVGNLYAAKAHDVLIDACVELHASGVKFSCDIAGEGERRPALQEMIDAYGLADHVRLLGHLSNEALVDDLRSGRWTAMVHPSLLEGIPVVLMEALEAGVPVIATPAGETCELVQDQISGLIVPMKDSAALADAMMKLLTDPAYAMKLARNGRAGVQRAFDSSANMAQLVEVMGLATGSTHSHSPACGSST